MDCGDWDLHSLEAARLLYLRCYAGAGPAQSAPVLRIGTRVWRLGVVRSRRMKSWLLALSGTLILATAGGACGGGGHTGAASTSSSNSSTTSIATTTSSTSPAADLAAVTAAAKQINLVSADFPSGWTSSPSTSSGSSSEDAQIAACAGAPNPATSDVADETSDDFASQDIFASSDITVVKTQQLASQDLAAISSDQALSCFKKLFPELAKKDAPADAQMNVVSVTRIPVSRYADGSFGLRLVLGVTVQGTTAQATFDVIGFVKGRFEVAGFFGGIGTAFPSGLEQTLLSKLDTRASQSRVH